MPFYLRATYVLLLLLLLGAFVLPLPHLLHLEGVAPQEGGPPGSKTGLVLPPGALLGHLQERLRHGCGADDPRHILLAPRAR